MKRSPLKLIRLLGTAETIVIREYEVPIKTAALKKLQITSFPKIYFDLRQPQESIGNPTMHESLSNQKEEE